MTYAGNRTTRLLTAAAATLAIGISTAQATPAAEVTAMLDAQEFEGWMYYDSVVDSVAGGVEVHNWRLTANALVEVGLLAYPDSPSSPFLDPLKESPVVLTVDTLHLDPGILGLIFGMAGDGPVEGIGFSLDGVHIDLAAMAGADYIDILRGYIGGMAAVTGSAAISVETGADGWHDLQAQANMDRIGAFVMDIRFDETLRNLPRGTIAVTGMDNASMVGLGAFLHRLPVEISMILAQQALEHSRAEPIGEVLGDPDMEDPIVALLEAELSDAQSALERYPETGAEAAAAIATWADAMATTLPDHAAFFGAVQDFASSAGTITYTLAPPADGRIPDDAGFVLDFYNDPTLVADVIEALGLTADFEQKD